MSLKLKIRGPLLSYLTFILFSILIVSPLQTCADGGDRNVTIDDRPYIIDAYSVSSNSTTFAVFEFIFATFSYPTVEVAALKAKNDSAAAIAFEVVLVGLVEYNDSIPLNESDSVIDFDGRWGPISVKNESGVFVIETEMSDKKSHFNATIAAYVTGNTTKTKDGTILTPSSIKFSFGFQNYPYIYDNSKIAIIQAIAAESVTFNNNSDNSQYTIGSNNNSTNSTGQYNWDSTVTADGKKVDLSVETDVVINASKNFTLNNSTSETKSLFVEFIAFEIQAVQPKSVFWDPTAGVTGPDTNSAEVNSTISTSSTSGSNGQPTASAKVSSTAGMRMYGGELMERALWILAVILIGRYVI